MRRIVPAVLFAALVAAHAYATPMPTLALTPSAGSVSGSPGSVTGWGYTIHNTTPDYMVLDDSYVSGGLAAGTYGTYVDYIASNFIVINPASTVGPVNFDAATMAGTGEFDIAQFVPPDTLITGAINVDYSEFSQNPNSPTFDPSSFVTSGTLSATAQVGVAPEPECVLLTGLPLAWLALAGWRRRGLSAEKELRPE